MRILLLGSDTPVGHSLRSFIPPLRRHELLLLSLEDTRWKRERQVKKIFKVAAADIVIDARMVSQIGGHDPLGQRDIERTEWLGHLSAKSEARYLFLSSSQVFSGAMTRPYRESDKADAVDGAGLLIAQAEQILLSTVDPTIILRLGWLFSGRGPGRFKQLLDRLRIGKDIYATDNVRDCPVHTAEVARVVSGIADQLSVGAPDKGIYHYGSTGDTGWFSFCEAAIAHASQREPFSQVQDCLKEDVNARTTWVNRALDCEGIRHQFGIQRRPWRDFVERAVNRYLELYCKDDGKDDGKDESK